MQQTLSAPSKYIIRFPEPHEYFRIPFWANLLGAGALSNRHKYVFEDDEQDENAPQRAHTSEWHPLHAD